MERRNCKIKFKTITLTLTSFTGTPSKKGSLRNSYVVGRYSIVHSACIDFKCACLQGVVGGTIKKLNRVSKIGPRRGPKNHY